MPSGQVDGICDKCYPLLPWCKSVCEICGLPITSDSKNHLICGRCQTRRPYFDRLIAALWYQPPISQLVAEFKYSSRWENARLLASLFVHQHKKTLTDGIVLPVPSHPTRIRERGFNGVLEFMRLLTASGQINYDSRLIQRVLATEMQTGKTKSQRNSNVRKAFKIVRPIEHEKIILFDDVVTTGATVNELSKCLKRHGVKYIEVCAIARTKLTMKM